MPESIVANLRWTMTLMTTFLMGLRRVTNCDFCFRVVVDQWSFVGIYSLQYV